MNTRKLSAKRIKILCLLAEGFEPAAIAELMHIELCTLHSYMKRLREQFGARNSMHMITLAYAHDIIDVGVNDDGTPVVFMTLDEDKISTERRSPMRSQINAAKDAILEGRSISEAARRAGLDRGTVTRHIDIAALRATMAQGEAAV